jgi:hypothetical protein
MHILHRVLHPWLRSFGLVHLAYAGLFLFGLAALPLPRLRRCYVVLLLLTLPLLAPQAWLVGGARLFCDGF